MAKQINMLFSLDFILIQIQKNLYTTLSWQLSTMCKNFIEKTPPFLLRTTDVTTLYPSFCATTFFPFWDSLYPSFCAITSKWGAFFLPALLDFFTCFRFYDCISSASRCNGRYDRVDNKAKSCLGGAGMRPPHFFNSGTEEICADKAPNIVFTLRICGWLYWLIHSLRSSK